MFTGIVQAVGKIVSVQPMGAALHDGVRLNIDAGMLDMTDVAIGDSIAINGACMTVVEKQPHHFNVEVSRESLNCTVGLDRIGAVNLEKALRLADRLGGHLVSGHVDGLGTIKKFEWVGQSRELVIEAPQQLAKYFSYKGSVVVNGVSLTVNTVSDFSDACHISINLIPHTLASTTLQDLAPGHKVNLEVDLIARYVERMLTHTADR